jgi:hypothetical protein
MLHKSIRHRTVWFAIAAQAKCNLAGSIRALTLIRKAVCSSVVARVDFHVGPCASFAIAFLNVKPSRATPSGLSFPACSQGFGTAPAVITTLPVPVLLAPEKGCPR